MIKTNGCCIEEKQVLTYPMWFKHKKWGYVVQFTDLRDGIVAVEGTNPRIDKDFSCNMWTAHTDSKTWEQVKNPNKELDKLDDDSINEMEEYEHQKPIQYQIGIDTFQRAKANLTKDELIACIKFNIDKYNWRKKGQDIEDFKKIIDYANFAIEVLKGEK